MFKNLTKNLAKYAAVAATGLTLLTQQPANAQTITLGGDDQQIFKLLERNGYKYPKVVKRLLTIIRTNACKGDDKFLVKVSILNRITSVTKIGRCDLAPAQAATLFTVQIAENELRKQGYNQIRARQDGRRIVAEACQNGQKFSLTFSRRGRLRDRTPIGRCEALGLSREKIAEIMNREGYRRITVTDDQLPRYVAEGCRQRERSRVTMNRRGNILSERRIGRCDRQFDPANISALLEKRGYDRIEIIDKRRPPYVAQACRGNDKTEITIGRFGRLQGERAIGKCRQRIRSDEIAGLLERSGYDRVRVLRGNRAPYLAEACKDRALMELTIGRFGRIRNEERVGRCAPALNKEALEAKLVEKGLSNIRLARRDGGWQAEACRDETKIRFQLDAFGESRGEIKVGECRAASVLQVLKTLEGRGAEKTELFVEGCYRGTKFRWRFDRIGNRKGRERIGNC